MPASLQAAFLNSKGAPVDWLGHTVIQLDRIPVVGAQVTVRFLSPPKSEPAQGVRLDAGRGGQITMADGSTAQKLYIWHVEGLPPEATHRVLCPQGSLAACNTYRMRHKGGSVTEDCWTNNAGMELLAAARTMRRFGCSDGVGDFDPTDLIFEIVWSTL